VSEGRAIDDGYSSSIAKQHRGRSPCSQHVRAGAPVTSATSISTARQSPGCLDTAADNGQPVPRIRSEPSSRTTVTSQPSAVNAAAAACSPEAFVASGVRQQVA
jgi:hypothetical protein